MDNSGGAKPKTMMSVNNNGSNSQQASAGSSSSTQTVGTQPRHRSQRMETGFVPRSSGRAPRGLRSFTATGNNVTNGYASRAAADDMGPNRRATVPSSRGPTRHSSSTQTRSSAPLSFGEYSPLRRGAGRLEERGMPWPSVANPEAGRRSLRYPNPVPRIRGSIPPVGGPLESPTGDVLPPLSPCLHPLSVSPSLHGILSSSEDSDSDSGSPTSPPSSSHLQSPASSTAVLTLPQANGEGRVGMSRDARLARELLQTEMDMMMQRDEEMARQLQDEVDDDDNDDDDHDSPSTSSASLFMNGGLPPRGRRFPTIPRRQSSGYSASFTDEPRRPASLRFMNSSAERTEMDPMFRHAMNLLGVGRPRGISSSGLGRAMQTDSDGRRRRRPRPGSPNIRNPEAPFDEYDPDERLLGGGMPPDDFLSMMNDPSLMLLMLLLRAPDSLYQNEAGVDLDDYEALWDLAEQLGEVRRRGISEEEIDLLPTQKFKSQSEEISVAAAADSGAVQCQICLVDFENGDCLRCIPCKHDFHRDCLDEWLKRNATCPICRQDVKPGPGDK